MHNNERHPRPRRTAQAARRKRKRYGLRILLVFLLCGTIAFSANRLWALYIEMHTTVVAALRPFPPEPPNQQADEYIPDNTAQLSNLRYIYRATGLFSSKEDMYMNGCIRPQVVYILEEHDNWLKIETAYGPKWIDLDFTPPTCALDELLARHGNDISVHFENIETGFVYQFNADRVYFSASVPKALYALYLYQLAERGTIDLESTHEFLYADANWGSGIIQRRYQFGARFSLRELLRLNISESDNVATLMLRRIHGLDGYRNFIADMGGNPDFVGCRVMNSDLTANEAGIFAREIFTYLESGGRYSDEFRAHLLDNQFPFIVSDYPVASKTGWTANRAWHDMAIVYAPSPYILVILTAREGWSEADFADFAEISMAFQEFNNRWFVN